MLFCVFCSHYRSDQTFNKRFPIFHSEFGQIFFLQKARKVPARVETFFHWPEGFYENINAIDSNFMSDYFPMDIYQNNIIRQS